MEAASATKTAANPNARFVASPKLQPASVDRTKRVQLFSSATKLDSVKIALAVKRTQTASIRRSFAKPKVGNVWPAADAPMICTAAKVKFVTSFDLNASKDVDLTATAHKPRVAVATNHAVAAGQPRKK